MIDLHLHFDGSLPLSLIPRLAALGGIDLPDPGSRAFSTLFQVEEDCRDLNEYLARFDAPLSLLQSPEQVALAVAGVCRALREEGLLYAELRFAPQYFCAKGYSQEEMVQAAIKGLREEGGMDRLILCCMRGKGNKKENEETIRLAAKYLGQGVAAADLAGAEALFPTADYRELFAGARRLGVPFTIHAGEAAGPESIWAALDMGASRIGHGIRAIEDPALVRELARRRVPLECCPISNQNTRALPDGMPYPFAALLEAGVVLTVNTDNRTVSRTSLAREFAYLEEHCSLSKAQEKHLLENAVDAAFLSDSEKALLRTGLRE